MQKYNSKRKRNVQQSAFPSGHPPEYYLTDLWLEYGRADGMPYFPQSVVVCACEVETTGIYTCESIFVIVMFTPGEVDIKSFFLVEMEILQQGGWNGGVLRALLGY